MGSSSSTLELSVRIQYCMPSHWAGMYSWICYLCVLWFWSQPPPSLVDFCCLIKFPVQEFSRSNSWESWRVLRDSTPSLEHALLANITRELWNSPCLQAAFCDLPSRDDASCWAGVEISTQTGMLSCTQSQGLVSSAGGFLMTFYTLWETFSLQLRVLHNSPAPVPLS